jgi:hypothetical protein
MPPQFQANQRQLTTPLRMGGGVVTGVGDVNGDLVVNVLDVILALVNAGSVPPKPPECDVNCDNTINVLDLILCLVNAGPV